MVHLVNLDDEPETITSIIFQVIAWIPKYHRDYTAEGHILFPHSEYIPSRPAA